MSNKEISIQPNRQTPPKLENMRAAQDKQRALADAQAAALGMGEPGKYADPAIAVAIADAQRAAAAAPIAEDAAAALGTYEPADIGGSAALNPPPPVIPKTQSEYMAQRMGTQIAYPDIADIFSGRAGIIPASGVVTPQPPPPPPQVVQTEIVVKYEGPDHARAYRATEAFSTQLGDTFVHFDRNQMINNANVIDLLLKQGCKKIVPYGSDENFITCPTCTSRFPEHMGRPKK